MVEWLVWLATRKHDDHVVVVVLQQLCETLGFLIASTLCATL